MNEINQKKAVIYCRVSTKEQVDEGNSLVTQEKICREYATKNGYDIICVFVEQGESAKTSDRTELQKLLLFCSDKRNKVNAVVAYKLDRISRNTDDYSQIRILLKRYGVEIKSTTEYFENNPVGRFLENTMANIAQFDNDIRTERSTNGMREAMREGRYVWMAPLGYENVRIGGRCTIAVSDKMGVLMRETFERVARNGTTIEEVRRIMTAKGLGNKSGKPLSKSYFYYMLSNNLYTGWIIKFGEKHKGLFEPLISEQLFEQVQRVLKYKSTKHGAHITDRPDFPLRRFIINPEGKKLTGSWSKGNGGKYAYYRLGQNGKNLNRDTFEELFQQVIDTYRFSDADFKELQLYIRKNYTNKTKNKAKEKGRLQKYITDLNERQTVLVKKNLDGVINDAVLQQQLTLVEKELTNTHAALLTIPNEEQSIDEALSYLEDYLKNPSKIWANAKLQTQIKLQWFQFPSGLVFDGEYFGTTEMCSFYKYKNEILGLKSDIVHYRLKIWNLHNVGNDKKTNKASSNNESILPNSDFTEQLVQDIHKAYKIIRPTE